ncbi:prephenate dehydrogenase [Anaerosolibacter carboniphilus]|uniref:Prephenate dehydrogenase n=1 Tax=Anaerosolibacter carboniphilus TaxID=1417629 RepID=A0A841L3E0_9FIRM|nr:prephenate dehydrogenase [Anaerosolibacter carboniphilus]MBB6217662.1 prephenate dehydrogenase [Anaerosolibacter carboniphilus]
MENFSKICIVGLGLMGGSMGLGLKQKGFRGQIIGYDLSNESMLDAKTLGAIDVIAENMEQAVADAQLVVIAVPIGYYVQVLKEVSFHIREGTIITDVGSVKSYVSKIAKAYLPENISFVGGHPMAGSEKDGIKAANPFLYENAYYFLTPAADTAKGDIQKLENVVKMLGAYPVVISCEEHDQIVSQISHLPHFVAVVLVNMVTQNYGISYLPFVGGGFRDTTRIASGNPAMWKDIFFFNRDKLLQGIVNLEESVTELKEMIINDQEEAVLEYLKNAKLIRDSIPRHGQGYMAPLYEIIVSVEDRPGVLGELTQLVGANHINIKEIEILHSRQEEQGAVRLAFETCSDQKRALEILKDSGFSLTFCKDKE